MGGKELVNGRQQVGSAPVSVAAGFYVAPNGNDNPGAIAALLRTLARAQEAMRAARASGMSLL
jgi:hypothetical protein